MELKKKLQWLNSSSIGRSDSSRSVASPAAAPPEGSHEQQQRSHTLEGLRERMAALLHSSSTVHPSKGGDSERRGVSSPTDPNLSSLPFTRYETPAGTLYRRVERVAASAYFGLRDLETALGASSEVLALLALDPKLAGTQVRRAVYLDTETTGLGFGAGTLPFLVGLAYFDQESSLWVEQLLLQSPDQERALMARVLECVADASLVVSFNGKAYDLPLLGSRCVMTRQPSLPERPHLDLLHVSRRLHKSRLSRFNLKHIEEELLGFARDGDIDGSEVPARYHHYLRSGDEEALRAVVDHNYYDVLSMVALVGIYGEPLSHLRGTDLLDLGETFRRSRALDHAQAAAEAALQEDESAAGYALRARLSKARGDKARALVDFEASLERVDVPAVRLELAKLYEHYVKDPKRALDVLADSRTPEPEPALEHRRARLRRKLEL